MKRLRKILFGVAALFASLLALANRSFVTVSFDPIPPRSEAWSMEAPLFLVILAAMFIGILIGGFAVWLGQRKVGAIARNGQLPAINSRVNVAPHGATDQPPGSFQ